MLFSLSKSNESRYSKSIYRPSPFHTRQLSYRNFTAVGDIQFQNFWDTDSFNYLVNELEVPVDVNNFYLKET